MTRLTQIILASDPNLVVSSYEKDGKFGIYIGTMDETPSGSKRPRSLLTSDPIFPTAEAAQSAAQNVVDQAKTCTEECGLPVIGVGQ